MLQILVAHALVAMIAPWIIGVLGRRGFGVLALAPAAAAVYAAVHTSAVMAGDPPVQVVGWVSSYGMDIVLRLDVLSWLMTLIVGGVGALVLIYCAGYFSASAKGLGRFGGVFVAFAGAMLGLVNADNTLLLYIFWELTTIFSFLLIGHYHERQGSRRAALQAIIVTTAGGLAMLGGIMILGLVPGGSFLFSELVASAAAGTLGGSAGTSGVLVQVATLLVLLGAFAKSAQVPLHFWLPNAMAAPTPVSAYLHSSAMVKGGVYLVARLAPGFHEVPLWQPVVLVVALTTMILGGYRALRQYDLKLVLAFGTVSQLGFITALVGHGNSAVALAGLAMILAHSLFKATLFLTAGVVDVLTGTRDLRELSGVGRAKPVLALIAGIASLSMAGVPPMSGYVAKEGALHALWEGVQAGGPSATVDLVTYVVIALGSVLTTAYTLRFWWGAFASKPNVERSEIRDLTGALIVPPAVTGALVLLVGLFPAQWERFLAPYANLFPGEAGHLTLWGGFGVPLWTTVAILALGALMFWQREAIERVQALPRDREGAEGVYRTVLRVLDNFAADLTAWVQRGSLPGYLAVIFGTLVVGVVGILWAGELTPGPVKLWDSSGQAVVVAAMVTACIFVVRARRRLKAVVLLGLVGYGMVAVFELQGAPDLGLTQVLSESITLVIFILVLRRLPAYFSNRPLVASRWWRLILAIAVGVTVAGAALVGAWGRVHDPISQAFPAEAYHFGYGQNIVNVTLVDIRAWDTMGEISVVVAAATGVASLIHLRRRHGRSETAPRGQGMPHGTHVWAQGMNVPDAYQRLLHPRGPERAEWLREPARGSRLLAGSATLAPHRRSIIFEMGVRAIFPTLIVFSLYLLLAGHNAPGGGFAAGLVAGAALGVRYIAGGRFELREALPIRPGVVLGTGLLIALLTALAPMAFGGAPLQSIDAYVTIPLLGEIHLVSAMVFDIGVYLVVIGLMLDLLHTLGAELDRQQEKAGEAAPDISPDAQGTSADDVVPGEDVRAAPPDGPMTAEELRDEERAIRRWHARGVREARSRWT